MLILLLVAQSWFAYLDSSLSYLGLTTKDITFRSDYTICDAYRFSIVDYLLNNPLESIDFVISVQDVFWNSSEQEMFRNLVDLYDLRLDDKEESFKKALQESHQLIMQAFKETPQDLGKIFEELTLFSPELTSSIEEDKEGEKRGDSLLMFLKDNGKKVDYSRLFTACLRLLVAHQNHEAWFEKVKKRTQQISGVQGAILYYEKCDFGEIVVGDTGKNVYEKDFAVIIDLGGDDVYHFDMQKGKIHLLIDKSGDDSYKGDNYSIACGNFGVSILIDEKGDDTYSAKSYSIGCGVFGVGILIDRQGNDRYSGDTFTEGAGGFGIGILKDEAGNDVYEGALYAQGFASTYGIGILGDRAGNDIYLILEKYTDEIRYLDHYLSMSQGFAMGFRPGLSAGVGIILEQSGNDYYLGDIFAQGSSYWYGIGAIVDDKGNDNYVAYQYAQGSGTHITIGVLIDKQGNDNYVAKGVSQGCGHDLSFGLLYDIKGDDSYVAFDLSQGAGNANGIGFLIDESGNDAYSVKRTNNTQGYGNFRREYGSIGVLLDIKGEDFYRSGTDKTLWKKGEYGIGIDWE
jgi:hypothetical protein